MRINSRPTLAFSLALLSLTFAGCAAPQSKSAGYFTNWPAGTSPEEIGKRVAGNFIVRKLSYQTNSARQVHYAEACTWYGSLTFAQLTHDGELEKSLIRKFDPLLTSETNALPSRDHVDDRVFGIVPLQLFLDTKQARYLDLGKNLADAQWSRTTPDGISTEARYWIDDMYMITALQVQAFRATGDAKYLDRAAVTMSAYLDKLQQPNGLFFHGAASPFYWSRGNGWMAAGMTELLRSLPESHPQYSRIIRAYRQMMASLLRYQGQDGLWRQLIDHPEAWPESSGTGMFAFAMVTGVNRGWLEGAVYGPAARKAWLGLARELDDAANVRDVCVGTSRSNLAAYYLARPRSTGDFHGQAPILWTATALLRSGN